MLLGTWAEWVSGVASFAAVVAALFLARQAARAKLDCRCQIGNMPSKEYDALPSHVREPFDSWLVQLEISVFNAGPAPTIVHDIRMQVGSNKTREIEFTDNPKATYYHPDYAFPDDDYVGRGRLQFFPVTLANGETTKWGIIVGEDDCPSDWGKEIFKDFVKTERDAKKFRFLLYTNYGRTKKIKPGKCVLKVIRNVLNEKN